MTMKELEEPVITLPKPCISLSPRPLTAELRGPVSRFLFGGPSQVDKQARRA